MTIRTEYVGIEPHGGELVDRRAPKDEREERKQQAAELTKVTLGPRAISDLEMISTGVFSPLTGFMVEEDYKSVVDNMHLANGSVWSLPITLSVSEEEANSINEGDDVALVDGDGRIVATMTVEYSYTYDKQHEAQQVYAPPRKSIPASRPSTGRVMCCSAAPLRCWKMSRTTARSPGTTTSRRSCGPPSRRRAGEKSSDSRLATRSTGRTSTSKRAPWRPWTGCC